MTLVRVGLIATGLLLLPALLEAQTKPAQDVWAQASKTSPQDGVPVKHTNY